MPERPLLILPSPGEPLPRRRRGRGGGSLHLPNRARQAERLSPRFEALQRALEARRVRLQAESHDLVPEDVVVLETIGSVENFIRAVEKIPGLEWLAEIDETEIPPDDDFYEVTREGEPRLDKTLKGRLFMLFTNQDALRQVVSMWTEWRKNRRLPRGYGAWKKVFDRLRDVRLWGVKDRLHETGVLDDWRERVSRGDDVVPCEIELWHRGTGLQRRNARDRVVALVAALNGRMVAEGAVDEIAYHALLAQLPVTSVGPLLEDDGDDIDLVHCEQIQFFRASGQSAATLSDDVQHDDRAVLPSEFPAGNPVIALLDGLPLPAHRRLQGRLVVDDPDDFEEGYPPGRRRHGTAMASLIVHGDMAAPEPPLSRPLYVRPILRPDPRDWRDSDESVPEDTLVVDLVHGAVRRLFDDDQGDGAGAIAPDVAVINLSIGIRDRPFEQTLSPLARLLDWLAWRYSVLFVVSAGNHAGGIELSVPVSELRSLPPSEVQSAVVRAVAADARQRRLLSPAEAVNAITVAAVHQDASTGGPPPRWRDPYVAEGLPSPINAQGTGFRRAVKPDVLASGGRVVVQEPPAIGGEPARLEIYQRSLAPGQRVAVPGSTPGDLEAEGHVRGTSNAAAVISRTAGVLYEILEELRHDPGGEMIDAVPRGVWLKALLAHGADWGAAAETLRRILGDRGKTRVREQMTRLLGYGAVDVNRVRECTARRVTALGAGLLREDQSHVHLFPLPPSLSGWRGARRLTISLAWLSPVNPRHRGWRRAQLWFSPPNAELGVARAQADWQAVQRGTVQHEILEGESSQEFVDGASLEIRVNCRADAGALEEEVPYALVTTIEVWGDLWVSNIYDEVRAAVQAARVRVANSRVDLG